MRILAICTRIPEEGKKGDQVLSFHRICYLARNHQIKLICFGDPKWDLKAKQKLQSVGISVHFIRWNYVEALVNIFRSVFDKDTPFQCALFKSTSFHKALETTVLEFKPNIFYAVTIRVIPNIGVNNLPLFVDLVDSAALNFSRRANMESGLKRFLIKIEHERLKTYESKVVQRAWLSFVVSSIDQKVIGSDKVRIIPLGIDGQQFYKNANGNLDPVIVFSGNMNYKSNEDAILWFYQNCWDKLKLAKPDIRLVIAGSNPTSAVTSLCVDSAVTVTGRVPSIAAVINSALVSIAPMQSGSGMQFKILEAMACGVPVVASSLGLGDIKAKVHKDLLIADMPDEFVQSVLSLLQSEELRLQIGNSGLQYVNKNHTWDVLNAKFEALAFATFR